jgi:hypothetical protein
LFLNIQTGTVADYQIIISSSSSNLSTPDALHAADRRIQEE